MKTQNEKMEILTYDEAISALKIYKDLTKQVLPSVNVKDQRTISEYNKHIEEKLKKLES